MLPAVKRALLLGGGPWRTTKRAILDQATQYGAALPGASSITAVHTIGTASASPTLTGTLVTFTDTRFLYRGGTVQQAGGTFPNTLFYNWRSVTYVPATPTYNGLAEVSFVITGQAFEFRTKGLGIKYRIKIDGLYDAAGVQNGPTATGSVYYVKVDLGSAATRTITIEGGFGFYFGGIVQNTGETLSAPVARPTMRLIVLGDSFEEGTGATAGQNGFCYVIGNKLGFSDIWASGSGGTGWVQINGSRVALSDRWSTDAIGQAPDLAIIGAGYNDINDGNDAAVLSRARTAVLSLRNSLPRVPIYVLGPWDTNAPSAPITGYATMKAAMQNAAANIGGCKFIDMQGVSFTKIGDNVHPDDAGHVTIGNYIYGLISADLAA